MSATLATVTMIVTMAIHLTTRWESGLAVSSTILVMMYAPTIMLIAGIILFLGSLRRAHARP